MCVSMALALYLTQLKANGRSSHTVAQIQRHVLAFERWLAGRAATHQFVAGFLASDSVRLRADGGPREASSSNAIRSSLRGYLRYLHQAGLAAEDAGRFVQRARVRPPRPRALPDRDAEKLLAALESATTPSERRDRALFVTLLRTGMRIGSAVALNVDDVDLVAAEVTIRQLKGGGTDVLPISPAVVAILSEHVGGRTSGPLFLSAHGVRVGARHVTRRLAMWCERAGVAVVSPHALRHAHGQAIYERTHDLAVVAAALSHRSVASSQVYARAGREAVRRAIGYVVAAR